MPFVRSVSFGIYMFRNSKWDVPSNVVTVKRHLAGSKHEVFVTDSEMRGKKFPKPVGSIRTQCGGKRAYRPSEVFMGSPSAPVVWTRRPFDESAQRARFRVRLREGR
jgi:hypothetical protein